MSTPTVEEIEAYQAYLGGLSNNDIACWFIYNYTRDTYGDQERWREEMDIAEFRIWFNIGECKE